MAIGEEIAEWASTRPLWQQRVLQTLAQGDPITEVELAKAIDDLLGSDAAEEPTKPLDLALDTVDDVTVTLTALRDCKGVNALADGEELDFGETELTVVYGDNGSGKSGYARLIKDAVGARHPARVLPDVFEERPDEPAAVVHYAADGDAHEHKTPGPVEPLLRQMHFYDEHCGDAYLARKSVITYRPSALVLLDGLIEVCDRLRSALADRLIENHGRRHGLDFPSSTTAASFVDSLSPETTTAQIETATTLAPDTTQKRADATAVVARLEASSAPAERARLRDLGQEADDLSNLLTRASAALGTEALEEAHSELERAATLREAATIAASADFDDELPGVGGAAWRALWEAARAYSTTAAYHDEPFPVTHDEARCPLCQQQLDADSRSRLERFDRHMRDTTEHDATTAERLVRDRQTRLATIQVGADAGGAALVRLLTEEPDMGQRIRAALEAAKVTRDALTTWLSGIENRPSAFKADAEISDLDARSGALNDAASAIDVEAFTASLQAARADAGELDAQVRLSDGRSTLYGEVERLKERRLLESAQSQVATTAITAKSTQLTKKYAGEVIKDAFVRETERLRLRRVTIRDLGGNKGQLEQQPGLLGAKASGVQAADVLSEGEQTAMGLAGFFTEAEFDASRSTLILDDPVNSLDHGRRKYVAARLVELAAERQVVVFTHDVTFAGELQKQAANGDVAFTPRSVERKGNIPGFVRPALPWKAKDFGARLNQIEQELGRLTRDRSEFGQDEWDKLVGSWAGDLSELWESCVNSEILDEVFDRGTAEVRVMKFRILASVTQEDDTEFQAGYSACSTWARRHNKAQETNYVPPEPDEMQLEVDRIREWQKRVKKYRA